MEDAYPQLLAVLQFLPLFLELRRFRVEEPERLALRVGFEPCREGLLPVEAKLLRNDERAVDEDLTGLGYRSRAPPCMARTRPRSTSCRP